MTWSDDGLLREPAAWLFGNEAWGLPEDLLALADESVAVPIYGRAESLNLAAAAAVCLYASALRGPRCWPGGATPRRQRSPGFRRDASAPRRGAGGRPRQELPRRQRSREVPGARCRGVKCPGGPGRRPPRASTANLGEL